MQTSAASVYFENDVISYACTNSLFGLEVDAATCQSNGTFVPDMLPDCMQVCKAITHFLE